MSLEELIRMGYKRKYFIFKKKYKNCELYTNPTCFIIYDRKQKRNVYIGDIVKESLEPYEKREKK